MLDFDKHMLRYTSRERWRTQYLHKATEISTLRFG